jgi:tetratricopeptide (TPR) repeat protein
MEQTQRPRENGPLWSILAEAATLLEENPRLAVDRAQLALKIAPGQQQALQLMVVARRVQGDMAGARSLLEGMVAELPDVATVHYELGLLLADMGDNHAAIRCLRRVVELEPKHPHGWRALGDALVLIGDASGAANAYAQQFASSVMDLKMLEQVAALDFAQMEAAEDLVREYLNIYPTDVMALQILGKMHLRSDQFESAENVFRRALEIAPSFLGARSDLVSAIHQQLRFEEENEELDILLESDPENPEYRFSKALALSASGKVDEAVRYAENMVKAEPDRGRFWLAYAHTLRGAGRQPDCIAAFRNALKIEPGLGEAWWGLSNLKTMCFEPSDVQALRSELAREDLADGDREFLHFALGKALEDLQEYENSFEQYREGNALIRAKNPYDADSIGENVAREKRRFTREFFAAQAGHGCLSAEPIFILGLPRSGSTLIEQILASHSSVEGGGELPVLTAIVRRLEAKDEDRSGPADNEAFALFQGEDIKGLGEEYLEHCRRYRKLSRPKFTDKMPSNFHHIGLIRTILPNARIIDARRHPLACCFSNFKQIFPSRHGPSYDLADIGRYFRDYVELMAHFDCVLPGRIHRVLYEDLVRDPEREIRRLLDYCGLQFEENCLRFYETERGIRTISSEQVRRPIYMESLHQWHHYEQWLDPLKVALGPVLDAYPRAPELL